MSGGRLTADELAAIREEIGVHYQYTDGPPTFGGEVVETLLAHIDALTAQLAAAERVTAAARVHGQADAALLRMWAHDLAIRAPAGDQSALVVWLRRLADALAAHDAKVEHANRSDSEMRAASPGTLDPDSEAIAAAERGEWAV